MKNPIAWVKSVAGRVEDWVSASSVRSGVVSVILFLMIMGAGSVFGYFYRDRFPPAYQKPKEITSVPPRMFKVEDLKPVSFLKEGESYLQSEDGKEVQVRARKLGADLGKQDGEYILKNSDKIPESFRGKIIVFPGTLLEDRDGFRGYWSLSWVGKNNRNGKDGWTVALLWANRQWWGEYVLAQPPQQ